MSLSFNSCSCNRGSSETELDDSTKTALEMEKRLREEPEFEVVTSHGTMKLRLYSKTPKHRDNFAKLVADKYYDGYSPADRNHPLGQLRADQGSHPAEACEKINQTKEPLGPQK